MTTVTKGPMDKRLQTLEGLLLRIQTNALKPRVAHLAASEVSTEIAQEPLAAASPSDEMPLDLSHTHAEELPLDLTVDTSPVLEPPVPVMADVEEIAMDLSAFPEEVQLTTASPFELDDPMAVDIGEPAVEQGDDGLNDEPLDLLELEELGPADELGGDESIVELPLNDDALAASDALLANNEEVKPIDHAVLLQPVEATEPAVDAAVALDSEEPAQPIKAVALPQPTPSNTAETMDLTSTSQLLNAEVSAEPTADLLGESLAKSSAESHTEAGDVEPPSGRSLVHAPFESARMAVAAPSRTEAEPDFEFDLAPEQPAFVPAAQELELGPPESGPRELPSTKSVEDTTSTLLASVPTTSIEETVQETEPKAEHVELAATASQSPEIALDEVLPAAEADQQPTELATPDDESAAVPAEVGAPADLGLVDVTSNVGSIELARDVAADGNEPSPEPSGTFQDQPVAIAEVGSLDDSITREADPVTYDPSRQTQPGYVQSESISEAIEAVAVEAAVVEAVAAEAVAIEAVAIEAATDEPVAIEAATDEAVAIEAVADEPVAVEAATDEPVAIEAATDEPVAIEAATDEPVAIEAATDEPVAVEAVADEAVAIEAAAVEAPPLEIAEESPFSPEEQPAKAVEAISAADISPEPAIESLAESSGVEEPKTLEPVADEQLPSTLGASPQAMAVLVAEIAQAADKQEEEAEEEAPATMAGEALERVAHLEAVRRMRETRDDAPTTAASPLLVALPTLVVTAASFDEKHADHAQVRSPAAPVKLESFAPAIVTIQAAVVRPNITPNDVAALVGAVRTFKPQGFGELLDAALNL